MPRNHQDRPAMIRTRPALPLFFALIGALMVAFVLPHGAEARPARRDDPIVILNNKGGNVMEAVRYRQQLAASGRRVEVRGYCRSACTIYITLPNACLGPGATVGFHAPRIPGTTIIPPMVDQIMGNYYRNGILQKWNSEWKYSLKMHKISAQQYVRLDPQTRICR
jgi:hypothetical protein